MKANAFRIPLLIAALFVATQLQAAPSLPITKPPVGPMNYTGPMNDPMATNGQWFVDLETGKEEYRTHEFYDNMSGFGGGNDESYAIDGYVVSVTTNALGEITAFDIEATIWNDTASSDGQVGAGDNSHEETRIAEEKYIGTLADTKLTAEFAIADQSLLPGVFGHPYREAFPYIIAENEDQRAWYCWSPENPEPQGEAGNYYVPTWDFGDIYINRSATRTLKFSVNPAMNAGDPRYSVIMSSFVNFDDVLANRTTSLKISTWIDDIGRDFPGPEGMLRDSDASVFHNEEEPYEPTHKMHWAQLPDPNGWDVRACPGGELPLGDGMQKVLADDFRCTHSGPITNITFWGSFKNDEYNREDPFQGITNFHLSLHKDIPDPDEEGPLYSMPVVPAEWEQDINPYNPPAGWNIEIIPEIPSSQGWWDPNHEESYQENNHTEYFRYEVSIPTNDAFTQTSNEIYWLDITVYTEINPLRELPYQWGWKTSVSEHFMDDGVFADMPLTNQNQWGELIDPLTQESLDLAFVIDGPEEEEPPPEEEFDWGDAPDLVQGTAMGDYQTLSTDNGANHMIAQGIYLGAAVDAEPDGQPDPQALGDDQNILYPGIAYPPGDEDGVVLPLLIPGTVAQVQVTASTPALLNAWIDFNNNGSWLDAGEQVATDTPLSAGLNTLNVTVPTVATPGQTFARFRYSTQSGLLPTGSAPNGEVEDYIVDISEAPEVDWGDADDGVQTPIYPTLAVNNGAHHIIDGVYYMGPQVDPEPDGQPIWNCKGDDNDIDPLNPAPNVDDEDGVNFTTLPQRGGYVGVDVDASTNGVLDAWVDWNADGDWADSNEQIFTSKPLTPGINSLLFPVPVTAVEAVQLPTRWRFVSSAAAYPGGAGTYDGLAMDGEVEDHLMHEVIPLATGSNDWGDAIEPPYPTTLAFSGANHTIVAGYILGSIIDAEPDGQPDPAALGDDSNLTFPGLVDDEDGVTFVGAFVAGSNVTVNVMAGVLGGSLDAWIDWNADGTFGAGAPEYLTGGSIPLLPGRNTIPVTVPGPPAQAMGPTYARFRLSSAGGLSPFGPATDGEVEDYMIELYQPAPVATNLLITNITVVVSNDWSKIEWAAEPNITYQAQSTTNLTVSNSWTNVGGWVIQNWQTNSAAPTSQFYRVTAPWTP